MASDGNLNMSANEKFLLINDALIRCKLDALLEFTLWHECTPWRLDTKA